MAHPLADQVVALFGLSPAFLLLTAVVGFFGFVVSATFGIGGVVLLIPLLSMALPPAQAWPAPTSWPTRVAAAAPMPDGTMNEIVARLIVIACAAKA